MSMPTKKARRGYWSKPVSSPFRYDKIGTSMGAKFFMMRPGMGEGLRKRRQYNLEKTILFTRIMGELVRVRVILKSPIQIKPTHWHSDAMSMAGRPAVIMAAYKEELNLALTRLGAN